MFFVLYCSFMNIKTSINKNRINLINIEGSEALKTQIPARWPAMWLNEFEFDVI